MPTCCNRVTSRIRLIVEDEFRFADVAEGRKGQGKGITQNISGQMSAIF